MQTEKPLEGNIVSEVKGSHQMTVTDKFNILVTVEKNQFGEATVKLEFNKDNYFQSLANKELIVGALNQQTGAYIQQEIENSAEAEQQRREDR